MTGPTARVLALLELLQGGGTLTVPTLVEQLDVDERTVRRYVERLRELDIPVDSVRGRYGGYRLARHYRLPPLMLTDEEALAVVWALLLTAQSKSGPASHLAAQTATVKLRRVLPSALARRIDAVTQTTDFVTGGRQDDARRPRPAAVARLLLDLAEAARDQRPVAFHYTSLQGDVTQRAVEPHGMVAHRGLLYLVGLDRTRDAARTFRLDRIAELRLLDGTFTAPADVDPATQVLGPLSAGPDKVDVSVRIRAESAHVNAHIPEVLASITPLPQSAYGPGWLRVFLRAERLEWVAGRLAVIDRPFVIEHPDALRDSVSALGQRLVEAAGAAIEDDKLS